jgi:mannitol-1-phosphate 5-dehydrogenase
MTRTRTLVGLGFGAIQAGLFVREAHRSDRFRRITLAVRRPEVAEAIRRAGGIVRLNTAYARQLVCEGLGPVEVLALSHPVDRALLIERIAEASDIPVAVSSVADYGVDDPAGLSALLAAGLDRKAEARGTAALIYASENHHHAAALLTAAIEAHRRQAVTAFEVVDTVIGKMSRVVKDRREILSAGLEPIADGLDEAVLVEAFNRILVAAPARADVTCGFDVFALKRDLAPFEHAKLNGHNATHAALAYWGALAGATFIADLRDRPDLVALARAAFLEESGAALIARFGGVDPLFTRAGYAAHVDDLIERMLNPFLRDTVARVGRDPARKLGWDDRLTGTVRLARAEGVRPWRYGAAIRAGLAVLDPSADLATLDRLWAGEGADAAARAEVLAFLNTCPDPDAILAGWVPADAHGGTA